MIMSDNGIQGRKRKRSESPEPAEPHLPRSSPPRPRLSSLHHESPSTEHLPNLSQALGLEPAQSQAPNPSLSPSANLIQGLKSRRSGSAESEVPGLQRSSPSPPRSASSHYEPPATHDSPILPPASELEPAPSLSPSVLPLTKANLAILDPTSSNNKSASQIDMSSSDTDGSVRAEIQQMNLWNHFIDDMKVKNEYKQFIDTARDTITEDRTSTMSKGSKEAMQDAVDTYGNTNEPTFLAEYMGVLVKKTRLFKPDGAGEVPSEPRKWISDDIIAIRDQLFRGDCLVADTTCSEAERTLRKKNKDLTLPKPDFLYGLKSEPENKRLEKDQVATIKLHSRFAIPGSMVALPWFIVEGKSIDGNLEKGAVQAARGATVIVASFRRLDEIAGSSRTDNGPDDRSYVYSLILAPKAARLNVHWALIKDGKPAAYHMHELSRYSTHEPDDWPRLRNDVNNCIEWGTLKRWAIVGPLLTKLQSMGETSLKMSKRLHEADEAPRKKQKTEASSVATASSPGQSSKQGQ